MIPYVVVLVAAVWLYISLRGSVALMSPKEFDAYQEALRKRGKR